MNEYHNLVFQLDDGTQVLVSFWEPDHATIAFRENSWSTWSPPVIASKVEKIEQKA